MNFSINFSESNPDYPAISTKLRQGWMFGRQIDLSDYQFRTFRQYMPLAALAMVGFALLNRFGTWLICQNKSPNGRLLERLLYWRAALGLLGLLTLHGLAGTLKIVPICMVYYGIGWVFGEDRLNPILTWIYSLFVIFGMEKLPDLPLGPIASFTGLYPRWWVTFNISLLRLISFNLDRYFSGRHSQSTLIDVSTVSVVKIG